MRVGNLSDFDDSDELNASALSIGEEEKELNNHKRYARITHTRATVFTNCFDTMQRTYLYFRLLWHPQT
jgi:hypothetical protein